MKLIDFGLACQYNHVLKGLPDLKCGTKLYMAPEVHLKNKEYTKSVDMWSLGITIYKLISGKHPLHEKGDSIYTFENHI